MAHISTLCRVLLVDSDADRAAGCAEAARTRGFKIDTAARAAALGQLAQGPYGVVVIDLEQPGANGRPLIEDVCEQDPAVLFVAIADRSALTRPLSHKLDAAIAQLVPGPVSCDELVGALAEAFE